MPYVVWGFKIKCMYIHIRPVMIDKHIFTCYDLNREGPENLIMKIISEIRFQCLSLFTD